MLGSRKPVDRAPKTGDILKLEYEVRRAAAKRGKAAARSVQPVFHPRFVNPPTSALYRRGWFARADCRLLAFAHAADGAY